MFLVNVSIFLPKVDGYKWNINVSISFKKITHVFNIFQWSTYCQKGVHTETESSTYSTIIIGAFEGGCIVSLLLLPEVYLTLGTGRFKIN